MSCVIRYSVTIPFPPFPSQLTLLPGITCPPHDHIDYALCISRVFCEDSSRTFYNIYTEKEMLNVVHTDDVVRAILHSASWYLSNGHQDVRVFNVADESNMSKSSFPPPSLSPFPSTLSHRI